MAGPLFNVHKKNAIVTLDLSKWDGQEHVRRALRDEGWAVIKAAAGPNWDQASIEGHPVCSILVSISCYS